MQQAGEGAPGAKMPAESPSLEEPRDSAPGVWPGRQVGRCSGVPYTSGLRVGLLISLFSGFCPPTGLIVTAGYQPPRVEPTRGAPSSLNVPVYCSSGILSSMGPVMRREQERTWATRRRRRFIHRRAEQRFRCRIMISAEFGGRSPLHHFQQHLLHVRRIRSQRNVEKATGGALHFVI
jgi:hypothetical protein